ncbi:MAG: di-trans,poly-cis-decaprenylcistransferase [Candidatus Moranbacteria bacterium RBG_13_45_13]|nr:MAG: di-trans,poly-cis-decaprenylcistransferase [Candidatus Moranbacteria bacterium RBG_13_45_13]
MKKNEKIPVHVAIIPDGNRRWARERGLEPWEGHEAGAKNLEKVLRENLDFGVKHITFWGSSLDNLRKRPLREKKALLDIYRKYFAKLIDSEDIHKNQVRVNVIGKWEEQFPEAIKKIIRKCIRRTEKYQKYFLNFLLAYSGDDELVEAANSLIEKCKGKMKRITSKMIKDHLMTRDLPPVDLLIRTGGEPHMSAGFMMWDLANAQMYFTETLWPDFDEKKAREAIMDYSRRARRYGG